jgi:hypothetical protein
MAEPGEVASTVLTRLRAICLDLPEAYEEAAWVGRRWRVRKHTFAHVLVVDGGWPPAYARAARSDGPLTVLTFRTPTPERFQPPQVGPPFFWPGWFADLAGMALDEDTDWDDVAELVVDSWCTLAPRKLLDRLDRLDRLEHQGGEDGPQGRLADGPA